MSNAFSGSIVLLYSKKIQRNVHADRHQAKEKYARN